MKLGRITISKALSVQILSEIFTIKGLTYEAHVSLRLTGKNGAFKTLQNLWPSTYKMDTDIKVCSPPKKTALENPAELDLEWKDFWK